MRKNLIEEYRLLKVSYGTDTGLVSLITGELIACVEDGKPLRTTDGIARLDIPDCDMEKLAGPEHNWTDLIAHVQTHYDWNQKFLPDLT